MSELLDFHEIYVPRHKRRFGSYVMPVLAGERLIGRWCRGCTGEAAIESLASFAGAGSVRYAGPVASGVS